MRLTTLSREMQTPVSTLYDRLKEFEDAGVLRHSALLDFAKLGFSTRAVVLFQVPRNRQDDLGRFLMGHANVNCLFRVSNGYSFLAECVFRSMSELEVFTDQADIGFGGRHEKFFVVDDVKREAFLANPDIARFEAGELAMPRKRAPRQEVV